MQNLEETKRVQYQDNLKIVKKIEERLLDRPTFHTEIFSKGRVKAFATF